MEKRGRRRPSVYTPEIAQEICERLAAGESLRAICRAEHLPDEATIRLWALDDLHGFFPRYAKARSVGYDCIAEEALEIADDRKADPDAASRRVRVDTRKWFLSKLKPQQYGDSLAVGGTGTPLVQTTRIRELSDAELEEQIDQLLIATGRARPDGARIEAEPRE